MTIKPGQVYLHKNENSVYVNRFIVLTINHEIVKAKFIDTRDSGYHQYGEIMYHHVVSDYVYSHELTKLEMLLLL